MLNTPPFPSSADFPSWTDANGSRWHRWEAPEPCTQIKTEASGKTGQETNSPAPARAAAAATGAATGALQCPPPRGTRAYGTEQWLNHTAPNLNHPEATKDCGKPSDLPSTRQREGLRIKDSEKTLQDKKSQFSEILFRWMKTPSKKKISTSCYYNAHLTKSILKRSFLVFFKNKVNRIYGIMLLEEETYLFWLIIFYHLRSLP